MRLSYASSMAQLEEAVDACAERCDFARSRHTPLRMAQALLSKGANDRPDS